LPGRVKSFDRGAKRWRGVLHRWVGVLHNPKIRLFWGLAW
jgi:hypothetical protein